MIREVLNILRIAFRALSRNKVRSALTALGVIIGVGSVIAMIALSSGARAAIDVQIQSTGTNVVYVSAGSWNRPGGAHGGIGSVQTLTLEDAAAIRDQVPTVGKLSPVARGRAQLVAGNQNWNTSIEGGNEDYLAIRNWPIASGTNFGPREVLVADKVCLLGETVAKTLFPGEDPVGQVVRLKNLPFRVLGVLTPKGQGQWGQDQDDIVIAPFTTIQKKLLGITWIQQVMISATRPDTVEPTAVQVTRLLRQRHRIQNPDEDDFQVRTVEEMAQMRTQLAQTMTGLLMSVASVSLLVGGIGIMNIMLVSVTERTREIGLRMAVGAKTRDILSQFLTEAVSLSVLGGVVGIVLGTVVSQMLTRVLGWPTLVTAEAIVIAFVFAAGVGIFFGYYPARKAATLDPIEALRYE
ncbi:MAG TPA: ABC transporter permease [Vicinamibacteria bacterium]|nr:ABC transporter permease [Vicinamibacteria bacterium]